MRKLLGLLGFLLLGMVGTEVLVAQTSYPINVLSIEPTIEQYSLEQGTRGIGLTMVYQLDAPGYKAIPKVNALKLYRKGQLIYTDTTSIWIAKANVVDTSQMFIPYRLLNLPKGIHENIEVRFFEGKKELYKNVFNIKQPARLAVELTLETAKVKEKLKSWDKSTNFAEWAPDPYWEITTREGTRPVASFRDNPNNFEFSKHAVRFYILEGEEIHWNFYDNDGNENEFLGRYTLPLMYG